MKKINYTVTNGCGGKKGTKCEQVYTMPYGLPSPHRKTDNSIAPKASK